MDQVPVTLKFIRERKNRKTGAYPFYLEVSIPLEGRPTMLPKERNECVLYATRVESEDPGRVKIRLTLIPAPAESSKADILVTLHDVIIWVYKAAPWMEEAWKERRIVRTAGILEQGDDSFTISFSSRQAR